MGLPKCNSTQEYETIDETVVFHNLTFHRLGLILSAVFGLVAVVVSLYLIFQHATHYLKPWEQRHIIRVIFMVPIYAIVSFLSYLYYRHSVYFEVIRDCYEAFAIASFFSLLCHYIAPDLHSQKDYFRTITPKPWVLPLNWIKKVWGGETGPWRTPRSGLTWFNVIWTGVFQYCFVRVFLTGVAVVTQAFGRYCQESLSPAFSHIWVMGVEAICVTIAMYCLIQFYIQLRHDLRDHSPFLKILSIKLVIFLSFWQTILISFLTSSGAIKSTTTFQMPDVKIGIPSMLLCMEMAVFSVLHLWAFPWAPYDIKKSPIVASESVPGTKLHYQGGFLGIYALWEAFNLWDMIKAFGRGVRWVFVGRKSREQDSSYKISRQGTDLSSNANSTYGGGSFPGGDTSYEGAGVPLEDTKGKPRPAHPPRYSSFEEGQQLLAHAQANPISSVGGDIGTSQPPHPSESSTSLQSMHNYRDESPGPPLGPDSLPPNPTPYDGRHQQSGVVNVDAQTRPYQGYYVQGKGLPANAQTRPYQGYYSQGNGAAPPRFQSPPR